MKKVLAFAGLIVFLTAVSCGSYEDFRSQAKPAPAKTVKVQNQDLA